MGNAGLYLGPEKFSNCGLGKVFYFGLKNISSLLFRLSLEATAVTGSGSGLQVG